MNMKYLKHILVFLFVITAFADVWSTILFTNVHPIIKTYETNYWFNVGIPLWALYLIKILIVCLMSFIVLKGKFNSEREYYLVITVLLVVTIAQGIFSYGNYQLYDVASQVEPEYIEKHFPQPTKEELAVERKEINKRYTWLPFLYAFLPYIIFELTMPYQRFRKKRLIEKDDTSKRNNSWRKKKI